MKPDTKPTKLSYTEIKDLLRKKDIYLSEIAEAIGVTRSHAYQIASGKAKSKRVAKAIAQCIGRPLNQVFGDSYSEESKKQREKRVLQIANSLKTGTPIPPISVAQS
ncbi:helix-turn-helix transcriptional regulator [Pseudoalteromonas sp. JBTF-M23]|uniref:Helix-turn-helix transcriptional regulator n=1 Tax=Pseudoalteromonas caenipelagi TaxID=2726988 RepID=A0A849V9H4_9GAMM|nr:helix-turn-helix transcriptional regulator [Pseudoalteromonas caenipelagi]NOU50249.1 helix-turn-helix transcriptional regulator [Pseudoalteromonas caenipelagi]